MLTGSLLRFFAARHKCSRRQCCATMRTSPAGRRSIVMCIRLSSCSVPCTWATTARAEAVGCHPDLAVLRPSLRPGWYEGGEKQRAVHNRNMCEAARPDCLTTPVRGWARSRRHPIQAVRDHGESVSAVARAVLTAWHEIATASGRSPSLQSIAGAPEKFHVWVATYVWNSVWRQSVVPSFTHTYDYCFTEPLTQNCTHDSIFDMLGAHHVLQTFQCSTWLLVITSLGTRRLQDSRLAAACQHRRTHLAILTMSPTRRHLLSLEGAWKHDRYSPP